MTLRIRGVVKAAQTAQDSLNSGIPSQEIAAFKAFVTSSLDAIEGGLHQSSYQVDRVWLTPFSKGSIWTAYLF